MKKVSVRSRFQLGGLFWAAVDVSESWRLQQNHC